MSIEMVSALQCPLGTYLEPGINYLITSGLIANKEAGLITKPAPEAQSSVGD